MPTQNYTVDQILNEPHHKINHDFHTLERTLTRKQGIWRSLQMDQVAPSVAATEKVSVRYLLET